MDDLINVLKLYDPDNEGAINQDSLNSLQDDIEYHFTDKEKELFKLDEDKIPYENIIDAVEFQNMNLDETQIIQLLESFDNEKNGKIFLPELINILKQSDFFSDKQNMNELLVSLPKDDQHYVYK